MKINSISAILVILLVLVAFSMTSCTVIVKEQRISLFIADLNEDPRPNSIRYHFSPSATLYGTITGAFFNPHFPTDSIPYSISNIDLGSDPITATIAGTGGGFGVPVTIEFTMVEEDLDWLILGLVVDGGTVVY